MTHADKLDDAVEDWLEAELADTLDEDYELELSRAGAVDGDPQDLHRSAAGPRSPRRSTSASCCSCRPS